MAVVPRQGGHGDQRPNSAAGHSTAVRPALPRGRPHASLPGPAPAAESRVLGARGQGVQSEKQFYALFPSPSCHYWVWALVRCFLEFSLGTTPLKMVLDLSILSRK